MVSLCYAMLWKVGWLEVYLLYLGVVKVWEGAGSCCCCCLWFRE